MGCSHFNFLWSKMRLPKDLRYFNIWRSPPYVTSFYKIIRFFVGLWLFCLCSILWNDHHIVFIFVSKTILFQWALQFRVAIILFYSCQRSMRNIGHAPMPLTWDVLKIIVDILSLVVNVCVFNQSYGHLLFFNVLHVAITMAYEGIWSDNLCS